MPASTERGSGLALLARHLAAQPPMARARKAGKQRIRMGGLWGSSVALAAGLVLQDRKLGVLLAPTAEAADALVMDLAQLFPDMRVTVTVTVPSESVSTTEALPHGPRAPNVFPSHSLRTSITPRSER